MKPKIADVCEELIFKNSYFSDGKTSATAAFIMKTLEEKFPEKYLKITNLTSFPQQIDNSMIDIE